MPKSRGICDQHDSNILGKSVSSERNMMIFGDLGGVLVHPKIMLEIFHIDLQNIRYLRNVEICALLPWPRLKNLGGSSSSPH